MKLLFVINQPIESAACEQAITALLGVSLFGQPTAALLLGPVTADANKSPAGQQLEQILGMELARVIAPSQSAAQWQHYPNIEFVDSDEIGHLIDSAESVVSF